MSRRFGLPGAVVLALAALTLSAGSPVPRAVSVDEGTCVDLCSAVDPVACAPAACAPAACAPAADSAPAGGPCGGCSSPEPVPAPACDFCVLCQCGIGIPSLPITLGAPDAARGEAAPAPTGPSPVDSEPASPPPKAF